MLDGAGPRTRSSRWRGSSPASRSRRAPRGRSGPASATSSGAGRRLRRRRGTASSACENCGLSGRKASYISGLGAAIAAGELATEALADADDEIVIEELVRLRGLGRWSAEMFLMFHSRPRGRLQRRRSRAPKRDPDRPSAGGDAYPAGGNSDRGALASAPDAGRDLPVGCGGRRVARLTETAARRRPSQGWGRVKGSKHRPRLTNIPKSKFVSTEYR